MAQSDNDSQLTRIYDEVRSAILTGELAAGAEISQVQLAEKLGVSRTPLREVLRMLQREGLVVGRTNRQVHIAPVSLGELEQIYAVRLPLEALALRYSVPLLEPADIAGLEGKMAEMAHLESEDDWVQYEVAHRLFHHGATIARCGPRFAATLDETFDHSSRYRRLYTFAHPEHTWPIGDREHRVILNAIKRRDADHAATRLVQHLARTALTLISATDPDYDPKLLHAALEFLTGSAALPTETEIAEEADDQGALVPS